MSGPGASPSADRRVQPKGTVLAASATERSSQSVPADLRHARARHKRPNRRTRQVDPPPGTAKFTPLRTAQPAHTWMPHRTPTSDLVSAQAMDSQRQGHPDRPADRGEAAAAVNNAFDRRLPFRATTAQRPGADSGGAAAALRPGRRGRRRPERARCCERCRPGGEQPGGQAASSAAIHRKRPRPGRNGTPRLH